MIKHELSEIEVCPDCYLSSITKHSDQWFTEPCRLPHLLVFAKIKGFPFWPAKALKAIGNTDLDVRFFGAHDRSIVSVEKCYWLSKEYPANLRNHAMINMQPSVLELNEHIKKLEMEFGSFKYAPSLMPVDLNDPFVFIDAFKGNFFIVSFLLSSPCHHHHLHPFCVIIIYAVKILVLFNLLCVCTCMRILIIFIYIELGWL